MPFQGPSAQRVGSNATTPAPICGKSKYARAARSPHKYRGKTSVLCVTDGATQCNANDPSCGCRYMHAYQNLSYHANSSSPLYNEGRKQYFGAPNPYVWWAMPDTYVVGICRGRRIK